MNGSHPELIFRLTDEVEKLVTQAVPHHLRCSVELRKIDESAGIQWRLREGENAIPERAKNDERDGCITNRPLDVHRPRIIALAFYGELSGRTGQIASPAITLVTPILTVNKSIRPSRFIFSCRYHN